MKNVKLIFSDNLHFHERNFRSLFKFIEQNNIEHKFMNPKKEMLTAFGNYQSFRDELVQYQSEIERLPCQELLDYTYRGVNVFSLCKLEMLSCLLPRNNWKAGKVSNSDLEIIEKAYSENFEELILNLCSGLYWVDFWHQELKKYKIHDFCCIFSGSNTYSRALIEVLKTHVTNPIIMESFFTGNEYYMEFKYESLPNNSDLRFRNVFDSYDLPESAYEYNKLKAKAINKVITAKNKNVKQPKVDMSRFTQLPDNYILIAGQVLNDYSILNTQNQLNSIEKYKKLVDILLKYTESGVVFKAHPWEQKKDNIKYSLTFKELSNYRKTLPKKDRDRLFILNHMNLDKLVSDADGFVTICSQSAFEAAFSGLKPITIGGAFFDNYGFTSSFESCDAFEESLKQKDVRFTLSLEEFESFERYLIVTLCYHLVCVHNSGFIRLRELLDKKTFIGIQNENQKQSIVVDNGIKDVEEVATNTATSNKVISLEDLKETDGAVTNALVKSEKKMETSLSEINRNNVQKKDHQIQKGGNMNDRLSGSLVKLEDRFVKNISSNRLYGKYKNERKRFFDDVQNPLVQKYWKVIGKKI